MAVSNEFWETCLRMRKDLAEMETKLVPALRPISDNIYHSIRLPDGHGAKLKIWRRNDLSSEAPLIVLFHGGGYFAGSLEMKVDGQFLFQQQANETLEKLEHVLGLHVRDPIFSPVNRSDSLAGQPRTYVQVGGKDALTDDGVNYAKPLEDANVEVKIDSHADLGHECLSIFSANDAPPGLKNKSMAGMAWLLGKEWGA
ncbi:hypothetical protein AC579_7957 [Pseudocercospora musae]|uniref:Alpha/beta hydrolase fold-3 domain-containing protein n=1 Tax=Pseudocercospora musae TaxID=113226 RepID=A0A139I8H0_9PEZI|nr:hypothetical protein AC579_7957 [Pseudocercospora musae]